MIAADIALHEAKERGGDRYEIFEGRGPERLAWVGQVRDAIDDDRLCLHAQPIFDLLSGERMGCEVLVRMFEGDGSVVAPGAFLPTAERFGLISEIDGWVVEHGIELAARGAVVTINVSARSIPDPTLIPRIRAALAANGRGPRPGGLRAHRDGDGHGERGPAGVRERDRADRLRARDRRLRHRLRLAHLPQAPAGALPEDRHGVRRRPRAARRRTGRSSSRS